MCKHEFEEQDTTGINSISRYVLTELDGPKRIMFKCKKCGKTDLIEVKSSNRINEREIRDGMEES